MNGEVRSFKDLESRRFERPIDLPERCNVLERDAPPELPLDGAVPVAPGVVQVRHAHFLAPQERSRFQDPVDLGERGRLVVRVAG